MNDIKHCRVLIVGAGPAGYAAAVYAARANLNPVMISGLEEGGQLMTTTDVDNWPGDSDVLQGPDLMARMKAKAERMSFQAEAAEEMAGANRQSSIEAEFAALDVHQVDGRAEAKLAALKAKISSAGAA